MPDFPISQNRHSAGPTFFPADSSAQTKPARLPQKPNGSGDSFCSHDGNDWIYLERIPIEGPGGTFFSPKDGMRIRPGQAIPDGWRPGTSACHAPPLRPIDNGEGTVPVTIDDSAPTSVFDQLRSLLERIFPPRTKPAPQPSTSGTIRDLLSQLVELLRGSNRFSFGTERPDDTAPVEIQATPYRDEIR